MSTHLDKTGRLLTLLAALERGQQRAVITGVSLGPDSATVVWAGGAKTQLDYDTTPRQLSAAGAAQVPGLAQAVHAPGSFPDEPLTVHQKWTELLDDVGGWHSTLSDLAPGLRLESISRHGVTARLRLGDGDHRLTTTHRLDDGHLVVGLPDDLATEFLQRFPPHGRS